MILCKEKKYECGSLRYSMLQIIGVFFWTLWGAMAFTVITLCFTGATPFLFRNSGLSDTFIAVVLGTVVSLMNTVMNPVLSTISDRCRSKLGRRIPFILYTALPTALFMAAMPFYSYLLPYLPSTLLGGSMQGWLLGFGAIICNFFWLFVGILFYYLIPDVVPDKFIGRYFGMYRLAGALAGVFWGKYLFPYVESHPQIVYPAAAALYLIIILLMCYFVKEGSYPPVEKSDIQTKWYIRVKNNVQLYFKECYSQKYYLLFYTAILAFALSGCVNMFHNFFYRYGCNMTMEVIGELNVWISIVTIIACFLSGFLVDIMGGFRTSLLALALTAMLYVLGGIFIKDYTSALVWRIPLAITFGLYAVANGRMLVEVYPRSKFGMIASGCNLLCALFVGLINFPIGKFSEFLKNATPETTLMLGKWNLMPYLHGYRFVNYWSALCIFTSMLILLYFYIFLQKKRTTKAFDM